MRKSGKTGYRSPVTLKAFAGIGVRATIVETFSSTRPAERFKSIHGIILAPSKRMRLGPRFYFEITFSSLQDNLLDLKINSVTLNIGPTLSRFTPGTMVRVLYDKELGFATALVADQVASRATIVDDKWTSRFYCEFHTHDAKLQLRNLMLRPLQANKEPDKPKTGKANQSKGSPPAKTDAALPSALRTPLAKLDDKAIKQALSALTPHNVRVEQNWFSMDGKTNGQPVFVNGQASSRCIAMHPSVDDFASASFQLNAQWKTFEAVATIEGNHLSATPLDLVSRVMAGSFGSRRRLLAERPNAKLMSPA